MINALHTHSYAQATIAYLGIRYVMENLTAKITVMKLLFVLVNLMHIIQINFISIQNVIFRCNPYFLFVPSKEFVRSILLIVQMVIASQIYLDVMGMTTAEMEVMRMKRYVVLVVLSLFLNCIMISNTVISTFLFNLFYIVNATLFFR